MYQPLFHFRGVAAGAETLRRNWVKFRNKIQLHSATTEGKKKNRCGYICLYMDMHVAAQFQAHKQAELLSTTSANSQRQLPGFILFKDLFCLKSSLYPEY